MKNTKLLVLIIMIIAVSIAVFSFWDTVLMFCGAAIMAYLLNPMARFISKKTKMRHGFAVAIVLLLFLIVLALLLSFTLPFVISQVSGIVKDITDYAASFDELVEKGTQYLSDLGLPSTAIDAAKSIISRGDSFLASLFTYILSGLVNFSAGMFDFVVIAILIIYFMLDGKKLVDAAVNTLPATMGKSVRRVMYTSNELTRRYIKSRVLISAGMGVVTYIGLSIMGIRYALLFAVLSFVMDFIPYFGSIIAGAIEAVYALVVGGIGLAVTVLVFVLVVQQIEGNIIAPKIQGDVTGIHPITVMFALLACNQLFGAVGMLISTPVAAVVKTIFAEAYQYVVRQDDYDPDQLSLDG